MKIASYRELQSKDELLPLFQHAFWWPFNPKEFEKTIKADPRLQNSPVGYAAIKNNRVVGFVGVMDIATRTLQGSEENVGGIWGVVTHPAYARKGISTALMQRSHRYFTEKDYEFSLLNTSKSLIAYAIYHKLGYRDVMVYPGAYKVITEARKTTKKSGKKTKLDWNKIVEIYSQIIQGKTGFVLKDAKYGKMLETRKRIQPGKSIVTNKGYALLKENEGNVFVQEIMALTRGELSKLIAQSEEKAKRTVIAEAILDNDLQRAYLSHGFTIFEDSYDILMYRPLKNQGFTEVYGNKFYAAATDYF